MTRKQRRLALVTVFVAAMGGVTTFILRSLNDDLVFFLSPAELLQKHMTGRQVRLGGLVEAGTVQRATEGRNDVHFKVTDGKASVPVVFRGILPDLFREGQGVVVLGVEEPNGTFKASEVLAKHDEKYMPKEVAEALQKNGEWQGRPGT